MKGTRTAVAVTMLLLAGCGSGTDDPAPSADAVLRDAGTMPPDPSPCAKEWDAERARSRAEGQDDGEARRRADQRRLACENDQAQRTPRPTAPPPQPCQPEGQRIEGFADIPAIRRATNVYLTCETETKQLGFPVYAFRAATASIEGAMNAYLEGVTSEQAAAGYGTALGPGAQSYFLDVRKSSEQVIVNFSSRLSTRLGAPAFDDQLIAEVGSIALQFGTSVQFELESSCEAFWEPVYGLRECRPAITRVPAPGTVGS